MCGIVGYIGKRQALPVILDGIKALEYRGYDSAGLAVINALGNAKVEKAVGKVANLAAKVEEAGAIEGNIGICHSRWATHGGITEANAHPHSDCRGRIWLAHNGIIENYRELKERLEKKGHVFKSETDTEVLAHLIEEMEEKNAGLAFEDAVRLALRQVRGTYGLVIANTREPQTLIAARFFSPLVLGIGEGEHIVASDASAILASTKKVIYLKDGEMAVLEPQSYVLRDLENNLIDRRAETLDRSVETASKQGFAHFMLKEIFEEPQAVENSMRGRLLVEEGLATLGGLVSVEPELRKAKRILISGCGTSYLAGKVGEYMFEEYAGIPIKVDHASEFRYKKPVFAENDVLLVISQSGETADTLAVLLEAKRRGITTIGIVNVIGSTIARETDAGVYQHIGPEIGVASTKAFASQVTILALLTLLFGRSRALSPVMGRRIAEEIKIIPSLMGKVIDESEKIKAIAQKYQKFNNFFFLGRKYNWPAAGEGALKLKEVSYAHAEAYAAGEMKHGPIALIDGDFPSVVIAPRDSVYEKMISNMEEIRARGGKIIALATEGDERVRELAEDVIYIPKTLEMLSPLLTVLALHFLAYYFGAARGYDVDKPRNLAKSVTVE